MAKTGMSIDERRRTPRLATSGVEATLSGNGKSRSGIVHDVSAEAMFVHDCAVDAEIGTVEIRREMRSIKRTCLIKQRGKGSVATFCPPLRQGELDLVAPSDAQSRGILILVAPSNAQPSAVLTAQRDEDEVRQEIRAMQGQRSNAVLASLLTTAAPVVTIAGFVQARSLSSGSILFATLTMFALFLVGVFEEIVKARAINVREGFLKAIAVRLQEGTLPSNYTGWSHLKDALLECGTMRRLGLCLRGKSADAPECKNDGVEDATRFNKATRLLPTVFDSLVSFSSFVYSYIYLVIVITLGYYLSRTLQDLGHAAPSVMAFGMAGGFLAGLFIFRWRAIVTGIVVGFMAALLVGVMLSSQILIGFGVFLIGGLCGGLAWYLMHHVNALRKGKHSVRTYYFTWQRILDNCSTLTANPREMKCGEHKGS